MKEKVQRFAEWAEKHHMALIYGAGALVLMLLSLWSLSILVGFWANGLLGTKFELNVGISGIATIATAGVSVYGIARAAQAKYVTDSKFNSIEGAVPYRKGE